MVGHSARSADPDDHVGRRRARHPRGSRLGRGQGPPALSLGGMDHQRRPQADRRDVHAARGGDAAARIFRRHHDARAAGDRLSFAGISAAGTFQPEISGIGTLVAGINLVTTVLKLRTRGMNYLRMPMFCWTTLATNLLIVAAFPILTATLAMLILDRYLGFHFFTNEAGGNMMMFMNLIWAWGHPEVYILVLPAFGIFSEVVSTFSGKPLFGYRSMVLATMAICVISFMVWLHHFFTMGAGPDVNAIFGIASMIIAVPTGVKIYNWLFTMYGGRVRFETPMLWSIGFMVTFIIGGLTGVLLAVPPADFLLHNSLFLIAHFHNVIIGGVLFGAFAGYTYWFPKAFGFRLHEGWGIAAFWFWLIGFYVAFMPLYVLGFLGMTRRMQ